MKLEHIALTISDCNEIQNFYETMLGFDIEKTFILRKGVVA